MTTTTTLNAIRAVSPCHDGWTKLLKHLGKTSADDEPLPLLTVLDSNGLDDALWVLHNTKCDLRLHISYGLCIVNYTEKEGKNMKQENPFRKAEIVNRKKFVKKMDKAVKHIITKLKRK